VCGWASGWPDLAILGKSFFNSSLWAFKK
jgi:hypothetical protein